ncbi:MAG: hypothetical protein ACOYD4_00220 [Solirubrobacterales bacterium]
MHARDAAAGASYEDLLVRNTVADLGQIPAQGALSGSPDVIPAGTEYVEPKKFLEQMGVDPGKNVYVAEDNYLYVRGVNHAPAAQTGKVHLYYSRASLLQYPAQWSKNELPLNDGTLGSPVSAAKTGDSFVTEAPFFWREVPQPPEGDHYCLIGRLVTPTHANEIPTILQLPDFSKWVSENRGMSWRNINVVTDPAAPTFSVDVLYEQGETTEELSLLLKCENIPAGCDVGFTCGTPGPKPPIQLSRTKLTNPGVEIVGITTTIPANFKSSITYSYWANGNVLPANAKITLEGVYVPPAGSELADLGQDLESLGFPPELRAQAEVGVGPRKGIRVGSHSSQVG